MSVFIQYWLIGYSGECPRGFAHFVDGGRDNCVMNGHMTSAAISLDDLPHITLTGQQNVARHNRQRLVTQGGVLADGDTLYGSSDNEENYLGLNGGTGPARWTDAESNVRSEWT